MDSGKNFIPYFYIFVKYFPLSFLEKSKKNVVLLTDTKIPLRER